MPWKEILGGASGGVAVVIVVSVFFLKALAEKVVAGAEKRFESALKRAEDLHKSLLAMATTIDTDLRARRFNVYAELWKTTGKLPEWPRNERLTYKDLRGLSCDLRDWYFDSGGIHLSSTSRESYGFLQDEIAAILKKKKKEGKVSTPDYDTIRKKCSNLRTELTRDLLSRREAPDIESGN